MLVNNQDAIFIIDTITYIHYTHNITIVNNTIIKMKVFKQVQ